MLAMSFVLKVSHVPMTWPNTKHNLHLSPYRLIFLWRINSWAPWHHNSFLPRETLRLRRSSVLMQLKIDVDGFMTGNLWIHRNSSFSINFTITYLNILHPLVCKNGIPEREIKFEVRFEVVNSNGSKLWSCAWDVCYIIFCYLLHIYFGLQIVFVCLYITPAHNHQCGNLEDIELINCRSDIFCRVFE